MKRIFTVLAALFLLYAIFSTNLVFSQTLHAIILADTDDSSENLRKGISKTKNDFEAELDKISAYTGLRLSKQVFSGNQFTHQNLMQAINNLNPGFDDVIFFYFIGHGILKTDIDSKWPHLAVYEVPSGVRKQLVPFKEIVDILERKSKRLLIAMAEACNQPGGITEHFDDEILGLASLNFSHRDAERLKDLYVRSEGTVFGSSSEPGQTSIVSGHSGGYFGQAFLEVHKELTSLSAIADWNTLFEKVKLRTASLASVQKRDRRQIPQYVINVRGISRPDFDWQNRISSEQNVFSQQPRNFNFQSNYSHHYPFIIAKIVYFNPNRVFFLMSDNYITEYIPYYGLRIVGYRSFALQPQHFQWDIISHYSPFNYWRWGVDYYGRIMEWHPRFGWQIRGIVYY